MARSKTTTAIHAVLLPIIGVACTVSNALGEDRPPFDIVAQEAAAAECETRHDFEGALTLRRSILAATEGAHSHEHWKTRDARIALDDVAVLQGLPADLLARFDEARALEEVPRRYFVDAARSEVERNLTTRTAVYKQLFGRNHIRVAAVSVTLGDVRCSDGR
jgi:hypothetical protein